MSRQLLSRSDRVAQMNKQEELIAKKKREILEKQKTAEQLKALTENMTKKTSPSDADEPENKKPTPSSSSSSSSHLLGCTGSNFRNTFDNDGSFLENFKKVTEAAKITFDKKDCDDHTTTTTTTPPQIQHLDHDVVNSIELNNTTNPEFTVENYVQMKEYISSDSNSVSKIISSNYSSPALYPHLSPINFLKTTQVPPPIPSPSSIIIHESSGTVSSVPTPVIQCGAAQAPQTTNYFSSVVQQQPPPPTTSSVASQIILAHSLLSATENQNVPALHTIPPPKPISLNEIPPPKDLDLNAIPKPQLNLDAIKIPPEEIFPVATTSSSNKVFSENTENDSSLSSQTLIPTTVDQLVEMVSENGDEIEDKIRTLKHDVDSSLWFIFSKDSDAYQSYRQKVIFARAKKSIREANKKYDPSEIYNNKNDDECNDSDSDYEYMKEAKERNLNNMKRKLTTRRNEYYSSDSDDDDDDDDRYRRYKKGSGSGVGGVGSGGIDERGNEKETESSDSKSSCNKSKIKKSRWGEKVVQLAPLVPIQPIAPFENQSKPLLRLVTRTDPALLNYARQNFGTTELTEEDWKKAEEHFKINLLYQDMLKKREEIDRLAKTGKFKYEYDSDEDTTGGTWEHKLRSAEMEATQVWAEALNKQSEGKHHIGDFLPPEELKKFMEQYDAKKNNREPDLSDYKEYKLKEDNIGFQMLQKLGWKEGQGLGAGGSGIVDPINKASQRDMNEGLGASSAANPNDDDNEYDAYRKRMMLAYRFRPNPLNNPRRAYY